MRVTGLGHAGLWIETTQGTILCDPWVNPAYYGSWFPFPDNRFLEWNRYSSPRYLYISHRHEDHLDHKLLEHLVSKETTVLLPDYPTGDLENTLRACGFSNFEHLPSATPVRLDGLKVMITPMRSPSDGPIGDSSLSVSDGEVSILNQNDAHLLDLEAIRSFGHYNAHFTQHTGAIWWPMCYDLPLKAKRTFARLKRESQRRRAVHYAKAIGADVVVPFAGPPAFLDETLFQYNGHGVMGDSIFDQQAVFLGDLQKSAPEITACSFFPGTELTLCRSGLSATRETYLDDETKVAITSDPLTHLRDQQVIRAPEIRASRATRAPKLTAHYYCDELRSWFEPLMRQAPTVSAALVAGVQLNVSGESILLDFCTSTVRPVAAGDTPRYWFTLDEDAVYANIQRRECDWVNSIFLSMRFTAGRIGKFNEYLYAFFTSLSRERMQYIDSWYEARQSRDTMIELDGWKVQQHCPHLGADFATSGAIENDVLTCEVHGWQFNLKTGMCLTTNMHRIESQPM